MDELLELRSSIGEHYLPGEDCPVCRAIGNPESADRADLLRLIEVLDGKLAGYEAILHDPDELASSIRSQSGDP